MLITNLFVTGGRAWHTASGGIAGYNLTTGKPAKTIDSSSVQSRGYHLRCYRGKATERFIITQFRGAECVSLTDDNHHQKDWAADRAYTASCPRAGWFTSRRIGVFAKKAQ